jgi:hypothetical protein
VVRKGEKGTTLGYADRFIPYRERTRATEIGDDPQAIPFLKRFTVFNADQCEGLSADIAPPPEPVPHDLVLPPAMWPMAAPGAADRRHLQCLAQWWRHETRADNRLLWMQRSPRR